MQNFEKTTDGCRGVYRIHFFKSIKKPRKITTCNVRNSRTLIDYAQTSPQTLHINLYLEIQEEGKGVLGPPCTWSLPSSRTHSIFVIVLVFWVHIVIVHVVDSLLFTWKWASAPSGLFARPKQSPTSCVHLVSLRSTLSWIIGAGTLLWELSLQCQLGHGGKHTQYEHFWEGWRGTLPC